MNGGDVHDRAGSRRRTQRRVIVTFAILIAVALAVVYGPLIASGNYHRATIERLAGDALGRPVTIEGTIDLSLLPEPQLRAEQVTIGGPEGGRITAATLKLDLAPIPLLLGRLRATRLTLRKPDVTLPWPLPGGTAAVAPPPWLASLHATIVDGVLRLGSLTFTHADLSIFTGGPNAVLAASGGVVLNGVPASITLDISDAGGNSPAPVMASLSLTGHPAKAQFKGTLDRTSVLNGTITATASPAAIADFASGHKSPSSGATLHADLVADGTMIALRGIDAALAATHITGTATIALRPAPLLRADIVQDHGTLASALGAARKIGAAIPLAASVRLTDMTQDGVTIPSLTATLATGDRVMRVRALTAALPGHATLGFAGTLAEGGIDGTFHVQAPDPATAFAGFHNRLADLAAWPHELGAIDASGHIATNADAFSLTSLRGTLGAGAKPVQHFTGAIAFSGPQKHRRIAAHLAFDRLDATDRTIGAVRAVVTRNSRTLSGPIDLTADSVTLRPTSTEKAALTGHNLLIDGDLRDPAQGGGFAVRMASVRIGHALAIGHGARRADGALIAARVLLSGPDGAATLAAIMHGFSSDPGLAWQKLPAFHHPFAAALVAAGRPTALHTGITLHLGTLRAAATPIVNLSAMTETGALTLHAPDATGLIREIGGAGWIDGKGGWSWPGPGSVSLRASTFATGSMLGLSNFVLTLGGIAASGRLNLALGGRAPNSSAPNVNAPVLDGSIAADRLLLPTTPRLLGLAAAALAGPLVVSLPALSATDIERAGTTLARQAQFSLRLDHGRLAPSLAVKVDEAGVAGGTLDGSVVLTGRQGKSPPTLSIETHLTGGNAALLAADAAAAGIAVPVTAGNIDLASNLTATGAQPADWLHDLAGSLTLSGRNITLAGVDLAKAGAALASAIAAENPIGKPAAEIVLRQALSGGDTVFTNGNFSGAIAHGKIAIDHATLAGSDGTMGGIGSLDLAAGQVRFNGATQPVVAGQTAPPELPFTIAGTSAHPQLRTHLSPALAWIDLHTLPLPPPPQPPLPQPPQHAATNPGLFNALH